MRMVSKLFVLILLAVIVIQLNAFPVPSYSYETTRQGQLQVGLGFITGIKPNNHVDNITYSNIMIKYGFLKDIDFGFDYRIQVAQVRHLSNIFTLSVNKGLIYNNDSPPELSIRLALGIAPKAQSQFAFAMNYNNDKFSLTGGYDYYFVLSEPNESNLVNGLFLKCALKPKEYLMNVQPFVFVQGEYWRVYLNDSYQDNLSSPQIIIGGGFSCYFNLLQRGEE